MAEPLRLEWRTDPESTKQTGLKNVVGCGLKMFVMAGLRFNMTRRRGNATKTTGDNARRRIPMTPRVAAVLEMRLAKSADSEWVFPAATKGGHIEPSSLKKQHGNAIAEATRILQKEAHRKDASLRDSSSTPHATRASLLGIPANPASRLSSTL